MTNYGCLREHSRKVLKIASIPISAFAISYLLNSNPVYGQETEKPAGEIEINIPSYKKELDKITVDMSEYNKKIKNVESEVGKVKDNLNNVNKKVGDVKKGVDEITDKVNGIYDALQKLKPENKPIIVKNGKTLNIDEKLSKLEDNIKNYFGDNFNKINNNYNEINKSYKSLEKKIEDIEKKLKKGDSAASTTFKYIHEIGIGSLSALVGIVLGYILGRIHRKTAHEQTKSLKLLRSVLNIVLMN